MPYDIFYERERIKEKKNVDKEREKREEDKLKICPGFFIFAIKKIECR